MMLIFYNQHYPIYTLHIVKFHVKCTDWQTFFYVCIDTQNIAKTVQNVPCAIHPGSLNSYI